MKEGLFASEKLLKPNGLLIALSFHSLEDRVIKTFLKASSGNRIDLIEEDEEDPDQYFNPSFELIQSKVYKPSRQEMMSNPRSRSAKLRVAKRTEADPVSHLLLNSSEWWKKDKTRNIHAMRKKTIEASNAIRNEGAEPSLVQGEDEEDNDGINEEHDNFDEEDNDLTMV